jgi:hypothetical protein
LTRKGLEEFAKTPQLTASASPGRDVPIITHFPAVVWKCLRRLILAREIAAASFFAAWALRCKSSLHPPMFAENNADATVPLVANMMDSDRYQRPMPDT